MILQVLLVGIGALPLLTSVPFWLSWWAAVASFLTALHYVLPNIEEVIHPGCYRLIIYWLTTLLWALPLTFGIAYFVSPEKGWSALFLSVVSASMLSCVLVLGGPMVLQVLLVGVGALPLLTSAPVWLSWGAAAASFLIGLFCLDSGAIQHPAYRWIFLGSSVLLCILPLGFGLTYIRLPDRGWSALFYSLPLSVVPIATLTISGALVSVVKR